MALRSKTFALIVSVVSAATVNAVVQAARADQQRWGAQRFAIIAIRDVPAGRPITEADIASRRLPRVAISSDAVSSGSQVVGKSSKVPLSRGQIVSTNLLTGQRATPAELLVGVGRVAVTVETGPGRPALSAGNTVVVIPSPDAAAAVADPVEATVVALQDNFVTLAVTMPNASALAAMTGSGPVVVALKGR